MQYHLSFLALLETKIKDGNIQSIAKKIARDWNWFSNGNNNDIARIVILWDPHIMDIQINSFSAQQITCAVKTTDGRLSCIISSIYGSNHLVARKNLWSELSQIHQSIGNLPWLICGDFNALISNEEKLGGSMLSEADTKDFKQFIEDCNLLHLKTIGCFFTWNNKQDSTTRVWSRLDRALVNDSWFLEYNSSHVEFLSPCFSNHSPALVSIYEDNVKEWTILTDIQARNLSSPVTKEEIRLAVFSIPENKAPGPDGYSSSFYKSAWSIVGDDVTLAIEEFFKTGKLLGAVNSTSITLIPKVHCPQTPADFRPISCCNCLYKFISKILANRLQSVIGSIISEAQSAFVKGRQISNNILLAHELVKNYGRKHLSPRAMLNIDIMVLCMDTSKMKEG
ncbi:uncharacterized protein LOC109826498 [Asparagus officinalis]|uniref:uncharacterized protein LOC109826498 n=1 Tax=Asparagus officinalis TaxID=4686 RepID=UPI00098DE638|nr:uncharacterized protein LOC109826498 [Asparagus officinalis]